MRRKDPVWRALPEAGHFSCTPLLVAAALPAPDLPVAPLAFIVKLILTRPASPHVAPAIPTLLPNIYSPFTLLQSIHLVFFLEPAKSIPTSGPLHVLSPLLSILFPPAFRMAWPLFPSDLGAP